MYIKWKTLSTCGALFWAVLLLTDLFGDCTWKRHSEHLKEVLSIPMIEDGKQKPHSTSITWTSLVWNTFAFLVALVSCSVLKSTSWLVWRVIRLYHNAKTRRLAAPVSNPSLIADTKLLFKNQQYAQAGTLLQENASLIQELNEMKKAKAEVKEQLVLAQKEQMVARQQIEEFKLEAMMTKEKLNRTSNSLKENLKYKDASCANHEMIERKAHNLEVHLREVSRDRDNLRTKLSTLEKKYANLEVRLRDYEKHETESNLMENQTRTGSPIGEPEVDMSSFQRKINELQRNIHEQKNYFEANSKISVDMDEAELYDKDEKRKPDLNILKQHILSYNTYKMQLINPKLASIMGMKSRMYTPDTTGSSSDECTNNRMISNTVEFQNFLKNLSSSSSINCHGIL